MDMDSTGGHGFGISKSFFLMPLSALFPSDFTSSEDIAQWDPVPLSGINSLGIINSKLHCYIDTVDGRTSAPPDMYKTL